MCESVRVLLLPWELCTVFALHLNCTNIFDYSLSSPLSSLICQHFFQSSPSAVQTKVKTWISDHEIKIEIKAPRSGRRVHFLNFDSTQQTPLCGIEIRSAGPNEQHSRSSKNNQDSVTSSGSTVEAIQCCYESIRGRIVSAPTVEKYDERQDSRKNHARTVRRPNIVRSKQFANCRWDLTANCMCQRVFALNVVRNTWMSFRRSHKVSTHAARPSPSIVSSFAIVQQSSLSSIVRRCGAAFAEQWLYRISVAMYVMLRVAAHVLLRRLV